MSASASSATATTRTWVGLAVLLLPALLTGMDASALFVAAAPISEALHPTATQWLWAMDIYSFVMAGLLITMGSLGDLVGRRKVLLIGAVLFGAASVLLAYATTAGLLVLARAAMAVGGATLAPSTLSLVRAMFGIEQQRRLAVGAWTVAFAGGAVAGPIIAGLLLEYFWWGAVFLVNLPVMALLLLAAPFLLAESKNRQRAHFDVLGAAAALLAILSLVFGMKHVARYGPDLSVLGSLLVGVGGGYAFVFRQRRIPQPLIDLRMFRSHAFSAAIAVNMVGAMVMSGLGALVFPYLQVVHGLTPLRSALWGVPTFGGILLGASAAAALARRFASAHLVTAGLLAAATGLAAIATLRPHTNLLLFLGYYTVLTFGSGLTTTTATALVLNSAPAERAGAAAAISETTGALGSALGIATLDTMASAVYRSAMTRATPACTDSAACETIGGAVTTAHHTGADLLDAAYAAYTSGITAAALVGAILCVLLAAVTATVRRMCAY